MSTTPSSGLDMLNQLMPLVSTMLTMFIVIMLIKELRGVF